MRPALGRRVLAAVAGAAGVDDDVVDGALAPSGRRMSTEPRTMSSSITTTGPANRALVRSRSTEPTRRTSARRVGTVHSPCRRSEPSHPRSSSRSAAEAAIAPAQAGLRPARPGRPAPAPSTRRPSAPRTRRCRSAPARRRCATGAEFRCGRRRTPARRACSRTSARSQSRPPQFTRGGTTGTRSTTSSSAGRRGLG